ncbi:MAG TPA: hypothetical protein VFR39_02235 [Burkholderiales bacterium]|jgi:hypothetical protein|nr:hypothetical protein [Burkholderiales bacterium]
MKKALQSINRDQRAGTAAEKNRSLPRGFAFAAHTGRAVQEWYWQEGALNLDPQ